MTSFLGKKHKKIRRGGKSNNNEQQNQDEKGLLRKYGAKLEQNYTVNCYFPTQRMIIVGVEKVMHRQK